MSRAHRSASQPLPTDMQVCLLGSLSAKCRLGVASGAFATHLQRHDTAADILSVH